VLKACMASNSSVLYLGSPNQRSGLNSMGSVQYLSQWLIAHWKTETTVCGAFRLVRDLPTA
jgi:hypothetical protein